MKGKGKSLVLLIALVAVLALVGCGSPKTKVTADEIVQNSLAAQAGVTSSHVVITIGATAQGAVNGTAVNVTADGTVTSDVDWTNKKMKAHLGMNVNLTDPMVINTQVTGDVFAFDNISYMKLVFMGSDNWTKSSLPMDFWFTQENAQFIDNLLQSTEAETLPNDKVGGVNCYVLDLDADIAAIQQMLSQQSADLSEVPDMSKLVSNLSIKVWVAKDTSYITKMEIVLDASIPSEVLGGTAGGQGLEVGLTITMVASDFNEAPVIELPAEAKNAPEGGFELPFDISSFM